MSTLPANGTSADYNLPAIHSPGEAPTPRQIRATNTATVSLLSSLGQQYEPGPGYAGAALTPIEYADLVQGIPGVAAPYVPPPLPPVNPILPAAPTGPQITEANRRHRVAVERYKHYHSTVEAVKLAYLRTADDAFFEELKNPVTGYASISLPQLIQHIRDEHDEFDADVRLNLLNELATPWDGGQVVSAIARINDVASIFAGHNRPLNADQKCDALHNAIKAHGTLNKDCTKWTSRPIAEQTWPNCIQHFKKAFKAYKKNTTTATSGFANLAETTEAAAAAIDRSTAIIQQTSEQVANFAATSQALEQRVAALEANRRPRNDLLLPPPSQSS